MEGKHAEMISLVMDVFDLSHEDSENLLTLLTEHEYIQLGAGPMDTDRAVFLGQNGNAAASFKLSNIEFNFRKAALSFEINAIEIYLNVDALLDGKNALLYFFLLCLKMLSSIKAEICAFDAELIGFLWEARSKRHLCVDDEYETFCLHMAHRGQEPPSKSEYHLALDRLDKLRVIKLKDGMVFLRERVVTNI